LLDEFEHTGYLPPNMSKLPILKDGGWTFKEDMKAAFECL
jgi:hypothetical protein